MPKGVGKYSWTMTMFHPGDEALQQFKKDVVDIWANPSPEKREGAIRIKFQMEWTTKEQGALINERAVAKQGREIANPLKAFFPK